MQDMGGSARPEAGPGWRKLEEVLFPRRVTVLAGHFGSGKTEITLNGALALAASGLKVSLIDLDVVKPYFRSRSAQQLLERSGIDLVAPLGEYFSSDLPIICADVRTHLLDASRKVLVDAGGNDSGVRALSSVSDALPPDTAFLLVLNFRRPLTPDVESAPDHGAGHRGHGADALHGHRLQHPPHEGDHARARDARATRWPGRSRPAWGFPSWPWPPHRT